MRRCRVKRAVAVGGIVATTALGAAFGAMQQPASARSATDPASASGPCTGTVNGIDVAPLSATDPDDAIEVTKGGSIAAAVTSSEPIGHYKVQLSLAGFRWTVAEDDATGTSWSKLVDVDKYARFGVGLYQVYVVSEGGASCEGGVLIRVTGSPFSTFGGWLALAMAGLGVGATALAAADRKRRVPGWPMALGAVGGLGSVLLAQQFAVAIPTRLSTVLAGVLGAATPAIAQQLARVVRKRRPPAADSQRAAPGVQDAQRAGSGGEQVAGVHGIGGEGAAGVHGSSDSLPLDQQRTAVAGPTDPQRVASEITSPPAAFAPPSPAVPAGGAPVPATSAAPTAASIAAGSVLYVRAGGIGSWAGPSQGALQSQPLEAGVEMKVLERTDGRLLVECVNGWRTWVDAADVERPEP